MDVANSVRLAINDWQRGELDAAMLHACNAVDGTARKVYPTGRSNARFTRFLRENYGILGPMGAPGVDLSAVRWPVAVRSPKAEGGKPDIADIIYGIHRCYHGHGEALPDGFALIPDAAGPARMTRMEIQPGKLRLSDRFIFALVAVAVFAPVNRGEATPALDGYYLTFSGEHILPINDWWGRAADFEELSATVPLPAVEFDFGDWTQ